MEECHSCQISSPVIYRKHQTLLFIYGSYDNANGDTSDVKINSYGLDDNHMKRTLIQCSYII